MRRVVAIIGVAAVVQLALAISLSLHFMFLSSRGAVLTTLIAAYAAAAGLLVARTLSRRTLTDVEAIQATLRAVADGRRDAHTGVTGDDDLAHLAADVDAMVDRLADEERARRMLIAAVSHDLRTPLGALALLASAIDDDIADAATRREYAARIATHVKALGELTDALFELTRLESGDRRWTMGAVALDTLVVDCVEAMRPAARAKAIQVSAAAEPALDAPQANAEQLRRVLFNLIENSLRHTPPEGAVTVRATRDGAELEVEVHDTGSGIPADQRRHVFEPFARGDDAGSGLGLAISRAIVEAHGGRIWLADAERGTSVRFRIPALA